MRWQDREGPTARTAQIALDTLLLSSFFLFFWLGSSGACRISGSVRKFHDKCTIPGQPWGHSGRNPLS